MRLSKQDEDLLLKDPDRFLLSAYLSVHPNATVSECMKITKKSRGKTHTMIDEIRRSVNGKMNTEMNGKMNAEILFHKGRKGVGVNARMNDEMNVRSGDSGSRKKDFGLELREYTEGQPNPNNVVQYPRDMVSKFYEYWSELDRSGKKMRFEKEKTWELPLRLSRWASNNFDKKGISHPSTKKIEKDGY